MTYKEKTFHIYENNLLKARIKNLIKKGEEDGISR